MKVISLITLIFAAVAVAAPAANEPTSLDAREEAESANLVKRGCPAGYSCQNHKCYQYTCFSSGWCQWSPSSLTC
ncbi:hypothetical protein QBC38DRAFT_457102 [Podospora fimiseda]|uniref:Chitin-binding type-1 domain-containing protein n=1 Tax=Podospora fimiseda TaxID=252190 RepID=A0AAN7BL56_9PEZI|nr:hypothetical protein QBC38DRAFT_457102 [Podospora fimiseda]